MRFMNVFSVFVAAVVFLPLSGGDAIASGGTDFVEWALEQGDGLDRTWDRITTDATPGAGSGSSTTARGGRRSTRTAWTRSTTTNWSRSNAATRGSTGGISSEWSPVNENRQWIHPTSGFFHKGTVERFPLSTRLRSGPSRGVSRLKSPASTRLGISHNYRRIPNARVPSKNFFHSRSGKWRINARLGSRASSSSRRGRVSARSSRRITRGR